MTADRKRSAVRHVTRTLHVSERRACTVLGYARSMIRYAPRRAHADDALVKRLHELSEAHPRLGYRKVTAKLRVEGWTVNKKRVMRLWRTHGLGVPQKAPKRSRRPEGALGEVRYRATAPHDVWAVDFVHDALRDGRRLKILTVTDEYSKAALATIPATSIKARDVTNALERLMTLYGAPKHLRSDNGPEFLAKTMRSFLQGMGVETILIEPGAPWQNPFAETFHARLRDELLNQEIFQTLKEADVIINQWRRYYNTERPHGALGMRTPNDVLQHSRRNPATLRPNPTP